MKQRIDYLDIFHYNINIDTIEWLPKHLFTENKCISEQQYLNKIKCI